MSACSEEFAARSSMILQVSANGHRTHLELWGKPFRFVIGHQGSAGFDERFDRGEQFDCKGVGPHFDQAIALGRPSLEPSETPHARAIEQKIAQFLGERDRRPLFPVASGQTASIAIKGANRGEPLQTASMVGSVNEMSRTSILNLILSSATCKCEHNTVSIVETTTEMTAGVRERLSLSQEPLP
jgi:hypothetical protein